MTQSGHSHNALAGLLCLALWPAPVLSQSAGLEDAYNRFSEFYSQDRNQEAKPSSGVPRDHGQGRVQSTRTLRSEKPFSLLRSFDSLTRLVGSTLATR